MALPGEPQHGSAGQRVDGEATEPAAKTKRVAATRLHPAACPRRLELLTCGLEDRCSIQLSYGHKAFIVNYLL